MLAAKDLDLPIVGDRTPEIVHAAETLKSWFVAYAERPSTPQLEQSIHCRAHQYFRWTGSFSGTALHSAFRVALVNTFTKKGSVPPKKITKLIESAHALQHAPTVLVLLDEKSPEAVRAARDAGAYEFLGWDEINNHEALYWRVLNALLLSRAFGIQDKVEPTSRVEPRPLTVSKSTRLSPTEIRAADAAISAAVEGLPNAEERRARRQHLLQVVAPELRNAETGRLNARRIAEATGLSLAALARSSGLTQQGLSATPDSPSAQAGLLPVARLSVLLDEMFTPEHKRMWLQTTHPRFGDRSPAQAIEGGDAELVALVVESALEGNPD
jgi:hypothetical protein